MSIYVYQNTDEDQILCKLFQTNKIVVLDLQKGGTLKEIQTCLEKNDRLQTALMIPKFDLDKRPFIIKYDNDLNQIILCNILKKESSLVLVEGSAKNKNISPASFFLKSGEGYEFHFCTTKYIRGQHHHNWYRW